MAVIDLVGQKFGRWTVIERAPRPEGNSSRSAFWLCRCECGTEKVVSGNVLRQGKSQSCGCYNKDSHTDKYIDLTNKRFGKLLVLQKVPRPEYLKTPGAYWLCHCDCGKEKVIYGRSLTTGRTTSCGTCRTEIVDDLTGQVFDQLTVIERDYSRPSNGNGAFWKCKCSCGNYITVLGKNLKHHERHSCGCIHSFGEKEISELLVKNSINFKAQYTFTDLKGSKGGLLRFDFAIFDTNNNLLRLIEFQGEQHYDETNSWFDNPKSNDNSKLEYCKNHNYTLVLIPYWKRHNILLEDILGDKYVYKN